METLQPTHRILVVDDMPDNRKLLTTLLKGAGYVTLEAADGREALALAPQADLILLDVMMPELDGFAVCRRLRSQVETREMPIVMITALDGKSERMAGLDAGADDFLSKPIDTIEFLVRVRSLLRLNDQRHEINRLRSELMALVAQDLQTPLATIVESTRALAEPLADDERQRISLQAISHARTLQGHVERMLDPQRLQDLLESLNDPLLDVAAC